MLSYLLERLKEKSTWFGGATAISALFGVSVDDAKVQSAFMIATFVLGVLTAGSKEKSVG